MTTEVSFGPPVTGSVTGTFLGADVDDISFFGSASWSDTSRTASIAATSSITLGGIESASFAATASFTETASIALAAPLLVPVPAFLDQLKLINITEPVVSVGSPGAESVGAINLRDHGFSNLNVTITNAATGSGRPRLALQYSLNDVDFFFLNGVDGPYVDITGSVGEIVRIGGPIANHVSESKTDVFLRAVTYSGSAIPPQESPTVFGLYWTVSPKSSLI